LYLSYFDLSVQLLRAISLSLGVDEREFFRLLQPDTDTTNEQQPSRDRLDPKQSQNTNLSVFRYFEDQVKYREPQRCMVHQDRGLITLLPRSTFPGLEVLCREVWIPIESFISEEDIVLYFGLAMQQVTSSKVRSVTHRVVRQPGKIRYSSPFELKPNSEAVLKPLDERRRSEPLKEEFPSFESFMNRLTWEDVMRKVRRADGIVPGSLDETLILSKEKEKR